MTPLQKLLRQPALITALVLAVLAVVTAFGVDLSQRQQTAVLGLVAAVVALLSFFVTPSSEVVAQQRPGEPVKATTKAEKRWGLRRGQTVVVKPPDGEDLANAA